MEAKSLADPLLMMLSYFGTGRSDTFCTVIQSAPSTETKTRLKCITGQYVCRLGAGEFRGQSIRPKSAPLTGVQFPDATRDFYPSVSFQSRLSINAPTAPVCNHMHQHLYTSKQSPTLTQKYCTHCWEWLVLLLQLLQPYPGKAIFF